MSQFWKIHPVLWASPGRVILCYEPVLGESSCVMSQSWKSHPVLWASPGRVILCYEPIQGDSSCIMSQSWKSYCVLWVSPGSYSVLWASPSLMLLSGWYIWYGVCLYGVTRFNRIAVWYAPRLLGARLYVCLMFITLYLTPVMVYVRCTVPDV